MPGRCFITRACITTSPRISSETCHPRKEHEAALNLINMASNLLNIRVASFFKVITLNHELLLVLSDADAQRGEGSDDVAQLKTGKRKRPAGVKSSVEKNLNDDTCKTSYSHWLMKSEPESRIENGVDVKVNPLFCACVHCFDLFVCLLAKIVLKTKIQHTTMQPQQVEVYSHHMKKKGNMPL